MIQNIGPYTTEYGQVVIDDLRLENNRLLEQVVARFEWAGNRKGPIILVCHALTGNEETVGTQEKPGWWSGLIGPGRFIDTDQYQVLTFNVLGGCSGSTGPLSTDPDTGNQYRLDFPEITIRDIVTFQKKALEKLGIKKLKAIIGGSLGGMQVLEWGMMYPEMTERLIPLAVTPFLGDYAIAYNRIGIEAIMNDSEWNQGNYPEGLELNGLKIARMVGMVTYRTDQLFQERFNRGIHKGETEHHRLYEVDSYLKYQGKKLAARFDANSYVYLLLAMNSHDIGRNRGGYLQALGNLLPPVNWIGFQGDLLYKPEFSKECARLCPKGTFHFVETAFGHDGFLVEFEKWGPIISEIINE